MDANHRNSVKPTRKENARERIPDTIRAAVKGYVRQCRAKGAGWRQVSATVGLSIESLRRYAAESGARHRGVNLMRVRGGRIVEATGYVKGAPPS